MPTIIQFIFSHTKHAIHCKYIYNTRVPPEQLARPGKHGGVLPLPTCSILQNQGKTTVLPVLPPYGAHGTIIGWLMVNPFNIQLLVNLCSNNCNSILCKVI